MAKAQLSDASADGAPEAATDSAATDSAATDSAATDSAATGSAATDSAATNVTEEEAGAGTAAETMAAESGDGDAGGQASTFAGYDDATQADIRRLGIYLAVLSLGLLAVILWLWPGGNALPAPPSSTTAEAAAGSAGATAAVPAFSRSILLLVIIVGMLGSVIGAASSFVSYVGNGTFRCSWLWWYLLRPLLGSMLSLVLYFVAQAGFLDSPTAAASEGTLDALLYQAVAIAGLAGMFSKVTADKLEEVFATILQSRTDAERQHKLDDDGEQL